MSALGDRFEKAAAGMRRVGEHDMANAYEAAASTADDHEAATLAQSAQGRGPHAAAVLRWAAEQVDDPDVEIRIGFSDALRRWADEAEAS